MEESPFFPLSPEDDDEEEEDDKPRKTQISLSKLVLPEKERPKEGKEEKKDEPHEDRTENVPKKPERTDDLSSDEEVYVNQHLAEDHLVHPVTNETPQPPVTEFLDKVRVEGDPDSAFPSTIEHFNLDEPLTAEPATVETTPQSDSQNEKNSHEPEFANEPQSETRQFQAEEYQTGGELTDHQAEHSSRETIYSSEHSVESIEPTSVESINPAEILDGHQLEPSPIAAETAVRTEYPVNSTHNVYPTSVLASGNQINSESAEAISIPSPASDSEARHNNGVRSEKVARPGTMLAAELAAYILGKRAGEKKEKQHLTLQKKLVKKVKKLENKLTNQELLLQKISTERKRKERAVAPPERGKQGNTESRINLTKPERQEHLGKVVVESMPKATSEPLKKVVQPEQVKTMRREDLLQLSKGIKVEGANLKDMYENHLFGERALRRLVEEHLKGHDILPELRREIVEHQIDFERDPRLRDRGRLAGETGDRVFNMLLETSDSLRQSASQVKKQTKKDANQNQASNKSPLLGSSAFTILMSFLILVLIIILIIILIKHFF